MPLTSGTVEELDRLVDIFFEKVGRKERMREQILKLMDECEAYLYPKIRDWMQLSRKQIIRDIKNRILKFEKKSKSQIIIDYVDWETIEEEGKSIIKPAYLNIMERSGNLSRAHARIEASFDVINPLSVKWAEKYSSELVTIVGEETKKGLREIVSYGLKKGKTLPQIARDIEAMGIGLNGRQTRSLYKYRDLLEAQELPKKAIKDKFNKYYDRLQKDRSKLIARTEVSRSVNEGYLDSLEGTRYEEVEISSAGDACSECLDLAGQRFTRAEARGVLPKHPNCRCHWIVVISRAKKKPKVPKRPEKASDKLIAKYKDKIEEQRKLTNEIALYRKKVQNAYYLEKDMVETNRYRLLMKEASAKRRYSINQMKIGMRNDLYVDKALRPKFRPEILFPDIGPEQKRKILKAINECEKFVNKDIVGRYEVLIKKADSRAFYDMRQGVCLSKSGPYYSLSEVNRTVIHEFGHFIEDSSGKVHRTIMEFYDKRTKGCPLTWLGEGFGRDELTRKDKFIDAYMGKDYRGRASEILSMGLQYFYNDPYKLAIKDPEYFNFIYKLVRGAL